MALTADADDASSVFTQSAIELQGGLPAYNTHSHEASPVDSSASLFATQANPLGTTPSGNAYFAETLTSAAAADLWLPPPPTRHGATRSRANFGFGSTGGALDLAAGGGKHPGMLTTTNFGRQPLAATMKATLGATANRQNQQASATGSHGTSARRTLKKADRDPWGPEASLKGSPRPASSTLGRMSTAAINSPTHSFTSTNRSLNGSMRPIDSPNHSFTSASRSMKGSMRPASATLNRKQGPALNGTSRGLNRSLRPGSATLNRTTTATDLHANMNRSMQQSMRCTTTSGIPGMGSQAFVRSPYVQEPEESSAMPIHPDTPGGPAEFAKQSLLHESPPPPTAGFIMPQQRTTQSLQHSMQSQHPAQSPLHTMRSASLAYQLEAGHSNAGTDAADSTALSALPAPSAIQAKGELWCPHELLSPTSSRSSMPSVPPPRTSAPPTVAPPAGVQAVY